MRNAGIPGDNWQRGHSETIHLIFECISSNSSSLFWTFNQYRDSLLALAHLAGNLNGFNHPGWPSSPIQTHNKCVFGDGCNWAQLLQFVQYISDKQCICFFLPSIRKITSATCTIYHSFFIRYYVGCGSELWYRENNSPHLLKSDHEWWMKIMIETGCVTVLTVHHLVKLYFKFDLIVQGASW